MSIWQKAVETYDCHSALAGVPDAARSILLPISHILQNSSIEITLDEYGEFLDAYAGDEKIIIPATERSAGRSGTTLCPHPLSDQLQYTAPYGQERYRLYLKQLRAWAESEFSHPKIRAVLAYVERGTIVEDLADCEVIKLDEDGRPLGKYDKSMIRWRVVNTGDRDACYEDKSLFDSFIGYYRLLQSDSPKELCMITGREDRITENHPKGTIASAYGAKLISANDSSNFTFRGRFTDSHQAATIGYESSQKAHNALAWVAANQGVFIGDRTFVCWDPKGGNVPFTESGVLRAKAPSEDSPRDPAAYKEDLRKVLSGWRAELPENDDVVIAVFDAATTGRLSITYYNELKGSDFLDRISFWQSHCFWENGKFGYQSPSIYDIVGCAYLTQSGGKFKVSDSEKKLLREQAQRMLHCIIDGAAIPKDIVITLTHRASTPLAYDKAGRSRLLFTACAVIYAYKTVTKKEEWKMSLEKDKNDRSYQFGRLLAVMEKAERDTYDAKDTRDPNAIRMQSVFCERPMYAAGIIHDRLNPYFARLSPGTRSYYKHLIGEIFENLSKFDMSELNRPLTESYLLGYYLQRNDLYRSNKNNTSDNEEEEK